MFQTYIEMYQLGGFQVQDAFMLWKSKIPKLFWELTKLKQIEIIYY
jgi:hypothetical protein